MIRALPPIRLVFFISYFSALIAFSSQSSSDHSFHIVLDPGHGGSDLGATRDSFIESKIVFQITQKIKANLDQQKNIITTLTRNKVQGLSLKDRVQIANDLKADLFVSLHANTSNSESVRGMEFYFNSPNASGNLRQSVTKNHFPTSSEVIEKIKNDFQFYDKTERSLRLAKSLKTAQEQKSSITGADKSMIKSTIKRAPFHVIENTTMPAALVELGFISNRREAKKLTTENYQTEIAGLLTAAILEYKEKSDKP